MFLRALQRAAVSTAESYLLKRSSFIQNGMKSFQHVKYASNIQHPQKVIPDSVATDFITIEKLIRRNSDNGADSFLFQCFEKEKDCFSYALCLMSQVSTHNGKDARTLAYAIVHAFWLWQKENHVSQPLTVQLQTEALITALSFRNRLLMGVVCYAFRINTECNFIYELIEDFVTQKKFEEAGFCIITLNLQDKFPIEKVLVPLVFQGNMNTVHMYVNENKTMQLELARLLDTFLSPSQKKLSKKMEKLMYKRLSNLLGNFKIPLETCPNLCEIRTKYTMSFLVHKKYSEQSISDAPWNEAVMTLLGKSPNLQRKLIVRLTEMKDFATAFQLATKFEIPADEWPCTLKMFERNTETTTDTPGISFPAEVPQRRRRGNDSPNTVNNDIECLTLHLDSSSIKYVETAEQFEDCLNNISKNYSIVGFDSEWKPNFGSSKNRLALLQLAVENSVYLLDMLALTACMSKSLWDDLVQTLFGNPKILKLGCGLISDVEMLIKNYQGTEGIPLTFSKLLDVSILFQKFQVSCSDIFPETVGNPLGLSRICLHVLGNPLLKQEQFSDWELRPLRDSQLSYAALDAYCLLQIYSKLQEIAKERNLEFDVLLQESITLTSQPPKETSGLLRNMKWFKYNAGFQIQPVIRIRNFKVLIDCQLEDLARELRFYGVDVVPLTDCISCDEVLEMAKAESRIILARSALYEQLKGMGVEKNCYNISEDSYDKSTAADVFQKFNVRVAAGAINLPDLDDS